MTDSSHCGTCGQDCFGGACESGQCAPVLMASELPHPSDGTGRVMRTRKDGTGDAEELTADAPAPRYLDLDDTHLYWTSDGEISRMRKDGHGEVEVLATGLESAHGILVADDVVYFCTYHGWRRLLQTAAQRS